MSVSVRQGSLWLGAAGASALLLILLFTLPQPAAIQSTSPQGAALRVQLDPETGEFVPVTGLDKAEMDRQMEQRLDRSTRGLQEVHHPDGGVSVDLQGRFQSLSVAKIDSSGAVHTGCVTSERELQQWQKQNRQDKE